MKQYQNKNTGEVIFVDDTDEDLIKLYEDDENYEEYFALWVN